MLEFTTIRNAVFRYRRCCQYLAFAHGDRLSVMQIVRKISLHVPFPAFCFSRNFFAEQRLGSIAGVAAESIRHRCDQRAASFRVSSIVSARRSRKLTSILASWVPSSRGSRAFASPIRWQTRKYRWQRRSAIRFRRTNLRDDFRSRVETVRSAHRSAAWLGLFLQS